MRAYRPPGRVKVSVASAVTVPLPVDHSESAVSREPSLATYAHAHNFAFDLCVVFDSSLLKWDYALVLGFCPKEGLAQWARTVASWPNRLQH